MRELQFVAPRQVRWEEVDAPRLETPSAALVRPLTVATCDLDVAALQGRFPFAGPYPLGHEGVAEVVEVGDEVTSVRPGDRVVVPFQISCGECVACRRGRTGNCAAHPKMSTYGLGQMGGLRWGGFLSDLVAVPHADAMLVTLDADDDAVAVASASDNLPDAWRCVGPHLAAEPEAPVLVVAGDGGVRSIGLYVVGLALALGSSEVTYVDTDRGRLAVAEALGATVVDERRRRYGSFPITVDACGSPDQLPSILDSTESDGVCTSPSVYLEPVEFSLFQMYSRCCTFHTGRVHARTAIPEVLAAVRSGFDPSIVTGRVATFSEAEEALADPPDKLVLVRD